MDNNRVTCHMVADPNATIEVERTKLVPRPSVYAIIRKDDGLLMVRGANQGRLFLPGGGVEPGETFEHALRREVWEETGLEIVSMIFWGERENFVYYEAEDTYWHVFLQIYICEVEDLQAPITNTNNPDNEGQPEWIDLRCVQIGELKNIAQTIVWDVMDF